MMTRKEPNFYIYLERISALSVTIYIFFNILLVIIKWLKGKIQLINIFILYL